MTHIPQSLHEAFPADADLMRALKAQDRHFQQLALRYEAIDQQVQRMVSGEDPAADTRLEQARKQRLMLLDALAGLIRSHKQAEEAPQ